MNIAEIKDKTLLLRETNPSEDMFFNEWIDRGYNASVLFKKVSKPLRAIRRIFLENNLPLSTIWYGDWFNSLDKYETVIIHMTRLTRFIPFIINKKYPNIRIICWYWNTVNSKSIPIKTDNPMIEYWSFDENDCKKYNMKENIQYYCKPSSIEKHNINSDIFFIGRDKGRSKIIKEIGDIAKTQNLKCNFKIIGDNDDFVMPYSEVKKELLKTKAVLEINKEDQSGLTLRALESLFYETKLITNNLGIKNISFYNNSNIFIIGEDDNQKLYEFINRDYDISVNKYKNDYELDTWFSNFFM